MGLNEGNRTMSCEIKILRITKTTQFGEDLQVKFWEGSWEIRESVTDQATWEAKYAQLLSGILERKLPRRCMRRCACLTAASTVTMVLGQLTVNRVRKQLGVEYRRANTN